MKKRIINGLGANAFGQIVTIIIQVVSVPIFLKYWGTELYGEWLILSSIQAYFTMSDIGFGSIAANEMTMLVSRGERAEALKVFQSCQVFVGVISIIIFLLAIIISWNSPIENILNLQILGHRVISIIILIMTLEVLINLQIGFLAAGFRCEGDYAKGSLYISFNRLFTYGSINLATIFGASPIIASLISLVVSFVCFTFILLELRRCHPWIKFGLSHISISTIKKLIIPSFAFMAFPIGNAFSIQGLITVIGITLGSKSVVVFSTLRTLSRFAWQMINTINNTLWPELSKAFGNGDMNLVRSLHRRACQASIALSSISVIFLSIFGLRIIKVWTIGKITPDPALFYLMLMIILFDSIWLTSSILPISINQHSKLSVYYLISTSFSIFQSYLLLPKFGLNAAVLSLITIDLIMTGIVIRISMSISQDNFKSFAFSLFNYRGVRKILREMLCVKSC